MDMEIIDVYSLQSAIHDGIYTPLRRPTSLMLGINIPILYTQGVNKTFGLSDYDAGTPGNKQGTAIVMLRRAAIALKCAADKGEDLSGPIEFMANDGTGKFVKVWMAVQPFSMTDHRIAVTIYLPEEY